MKQTTNGIVMPIALICINKSRLKVYHKENNPTYYLQKGQEFQIELFNPTLNTVLAKIKLNGNSISQGGLVLRPGERIFLERYIDVAKKFMFDTYEVSDTEEVKKAIENNGDFKVEFYKESIPSYVYGTNTTYITQPSTLTIHGTPNYFYDSFSTSSVAGSINLTTSNSTSSYFTDSFVNYSNNNATLSVKKDRSIETGRVEKGSDSNQGLEYVNKSFDIYAFHTVEYKLLPTSQKINSSDDIKIKKYCHNCGAKQKPEFKFCPSCGIKA
jgi:hypothetical protein